jgi:hypothetical protein
MLVLVILLLSGVQLVSGIGSPIGLSESFDGVVLSKELLLKVHNMGFQLFILSGHFFQGLFIIVNPYGYIGSRSGLRVLLSQVGGPLEDFGQGPPGYLGCRGFDFLLFIRLFQEVLQIRDIILVEVLPGVVSSIKFVGHF